jgi:hypothetical protein
MNYTLHIREVVGSCERHFIQDRRGKKAQPGTFN